MTQFEILEPNTHFTSLLGNKWNLLDPKGLLEKVFKNRSVDERLRSAAFDLHYALKYYKKFHLAMEHIENHLEKLILDRTLLDQNLDFMNSLEGVEARIQLFNKGKEKPENVVAAIATAFKPLINLTKRLTRIAKDRGWKIAAKSQAAAKQKAQEKAEALA